MVRVLSLLLLLLLGACTSVQGSLTGKLSVQVDGLPSGVEARVVVQPLGKAVSASQVLEVPEGTYEVVAEAVEGPSGERYVPTVEGSPARVEYGKVVQVRVSYQVDRDTLPATLILVIEGLPEGAEGSLRVSGEGVNQVVKSTGRLTLRPGVYTLRADAVSYAGERYIPSPASDYVVLAPGSTVSKTFTYTREVRTGELLITIQGLPSGTQAQVRVRDGSGTSVASLTESRLLTLPAGVYFVEADPVGTYVPQVSGSPANVQAGGRAEVRVVYENRPASLSLTLEPASLTIPRGATGTLRATLTPQNFQGQVNFSLQGAPSGVSLSPGTVQVSGATQATLTLSVGTSVAPGTYSLVVKAEGGGVSRTQTLSVQVSPTTGQLALSILFQGAPAGTEGHVVVSGPGGDQVITRSGVLTLAPGTYTITAYSVVVGGTQYNPEPPGGTVQVLAGQTASFTITYKPPTGP